MKEMSPTGEISHSYEKNDLTKNLLLATDMDETVRIYKVDSLTLHEIIIHHHSLTS